MVIIAQKIKLFCIPYAGGSASIYNSWSKYLDNEIKVYPIELSGRGKRIKEPFYDNVEHAVNDIYDRIKSELSGDYALFGHSMGSLLSYELAHKIISLHHQKPQHIFFSGRMPPDIDWNNKMMHKMPYNDFIKEIIQLGGTPREIFENTDLLDIFIPILNADYRIVETYRFEKKPEKFDFNITVFNGTDDEDVNHNELMKWCTHTDKMCKIYEFEGGHFFIKDKLHEVMAIINNTLIKA